MNEVNITTKEYSLQFLGPVIHISTDLSNYYTKEETNQAINTAKEQTLTTVSQNYVNNTTFNTTLSNYYTKTQIDQTLGDYVTTSSLGTTLSNYVTTTALGTILADYQTKENLVTSLSSASTDTQYPSAKCVYDIIGDVESLLNNINSGS